MKRVERAPLRMTGPANPTTTENDVTIIKHCCLPRSHSSLRIVQLYMGATIFELHHRRAGPGMAIPNFYCHVRFFAVAGVDATCFLGIDREAAVNARGCRMPIHSIEFEFLRCQVVSASDNHAIRRRIEIDNITRPHRTPRQTFALPDREEFNAVMFAQKISCNIVNFAAMKLVFAEVRTQKCLIIVPGNKADFLAIHLVRNPEA